jgi:hypothetical protein
MSDNRPDDKPIGPFKLTSGRIVLLVMGLLLVLIIASQLMGGLSNYQQLREASAPVTPAN